MNKLIYIHGTNGSGKTTLAKALIGYTGGVKEYRRSMTFTKTNLILLGEYYRKKGSGGIDTIQPYKNVLILLKELSTKKYITVLGEGLVTPGYKTCRRMASYFDKAYFIHLDTSEEDCIANVLTRRADAGNKKKYNPKNLQRKLVSAKRWAANLEEQNLPVESLSYDKALKLCKKLVKQSTSPIEFTAQSYKIKWGMY